ncbi:alpha/beta fold hydrolase, partial [Candidatus Saccharibacteria bacterium]|nr:alpha/beta fold hydrolase [Candidatus Saccharibacteria bacterium]
PGFGDRLDCFRRLALVSWRLRGMKAVLVPMRWHDADETFAQKYARAAEMIKQQQAKKVVIIGESAGGAMVMALLEKYAHRFAAVVTVCGYNHDADKIGAKYRMRNPAFFDAVSAADMAVASLPTVFKKKMYVLFTPSDVTVKQEHSHIAGVSSVTIPGYTHMGAIARFLICPQNSTFTLRRDE